MPFVGEIAALRLEKKRGDDSEVHRGAEVESSGAAGRGRKYGDGVDDELTAKEQTVKDDKDTL